MKLKNILIVVKDIEKSKRFYHDLFGLDMVLDNNGNMILTEGLVLQDEKIWEKYGKNFLEKILSRKTILVSYILRNKIWKRLLKNWKHYILRFNMLIISWCTAGDRK